MQNSDDKHAEGVKLLALTIALLQRTGTLDRLISIKTDTEFGTFWKNRKKGWPEFIGQF